MNIVGHQIIQDGRELVTPVIVSRVNMDASKLRKFVSTLVITSIGTDVRYLP